VHRAGLIAIAASLAVVACKSETKVATKVATETKTKALDKLDVPTDVVWAGSAHLRVVDVAAGQVVAGVDLQKSITHIAFTPDGTRGFVAASDGVREIDVQTHAVKAHLTKHPARRLYPSADGSKLFVLEHEVKMLESGAREVLPFRLKTIDLATGGVLGEETIGQKILAAVPSLTKDRLHTVLTQAGDLKTAPMGAKLADAARVELPEPVAAGFGMRPYVAISPDGRFVYVPMEGKIGHVLAIDRTDGSARAISLGEPLLLRGLAVTPDGKRLVVNASAVALVVDIASGKVQGKVELGAQHIDAAVGTDGRRAYLAQTIDGTGGAVTVLHLDKLKVQGKIHLGDISPWVLAVKPRTAYASN